MRGFRVISAALSVTALAAGVFFIGQGGEASEPPQVRAEAIISGCVDGSITGHARLVERKSEEGIKTVRIQMLVDGLPDGQHAVHLHETATCTPCGSAGGHFDPGPVGLTSPDGNHPFHMGDLTQMTVKNGKGDYKAITTRVTLSPGPLSLFDLDGSAFIIHDNPDSYCPNGNEPGCAGGSRAACGIITLTN